MFWRKKKIPQYLTDMVEERRNNMYKIHRLDDEIEMLQRKRSNLLGRNFDIEDFLVMHPVEW